MPDVYVGVGSNVAPEPNLRLAVERLEARYGSLTCSQAYRSEAYGFDGADFLNMVVRFRSEQGADVVAAALSRIERAAGRADSDRVRSRTLDLDLLMYGCTVDPVRRLPRIDVLRYPFVLAPLCDIAPTLHHPVTGVSICDVWQSLSVRGGFRCEPIGPVAAL
jgi:2-amino-4-hydroxy-6-hydroxymethyldihydropteridine diphosphokinase